MEGVNVSFGKMNTFISIVEPRKTKDSEGFAATEDVVVASVRAYREGRHGSEKWANRAAFSEATDLFRFRCTPGVKITTAMVIRCGDTRFNIRPLAKLSKAVKVADTSNQGKAESKALSPVTVTLREDTKPFDKADGVFNKDTLP